MKNITMLAAVAGSLLLSACAGWSTLTTTDEPAKLHALFDAQWQRELQENPPLQRPLGSADADGD